MSGDFTASPDAADFEQLADTRWPLFRKAYSRVTPEMKAAIADFTEENREWLPDYALFMALKEEKYHHAPVYMWPEKDVRDRKPEALARVTEELRGEIDFRESFSRRVALLKGLDVSVMDEIARSLPITEGLERMMTILKRVGYKTAILSGGFTYFGNYLRQKYGFDYVYANELEIEDGRLTGRYVGEVVDGRRKAELLRLLCQFEEINIARRRRRQRPADAQPRGSGHCVPRQTQGKSHGPAVDFDDRTGRHPLLPRAERFAHRSLIRYAPLPPHRRRLGRASDGRVLRLPIRGAGRQCARRTCDGDHRRTACTLRRNAVHGHGRHRGRRDGHDQRPGGEFLPHALHRGR